MNRLKSLLIGGLLASVSIAALSQNANAEPVDFHQDHFHNNTIAFDNARIIRERQLHEQQLREFRERQAREFRERQARELRERQARELHARELHAREFRERQARLHY